MTSAFLEESLALLQRTPAVLDSLLRELPEGWTTATEGHGTWSPHDVMGHLVHVERTDWMERLARILAHGTSRPFDRLDREAQFRETARPLPVLLDEFAALRRDNLGRLREWNLQPEQLGLQGTHPTLGPVTLGQVLAAWTAHDLGHTLQIARVMARRYKEAAGPFADFFSVMR